MAEARRSKPRPEFAAEQAVRGALERFVIAFSSLDWEPFRAAFAEDVVFFFPFIRGRWVPRRVDGWQGVEAVFKPFFEDMHRKAEGPAYLEIVPKDVKIQMLGDVSEVGIATFHLYEETVLGRRTIVFQRRQGKWLIVHVHASMVETTQA